MTTITIRDKKVAQDMQSPYTVLVSCNATPFSAYKTIEEFMSEWHDTLSEMGLKALHFASMGAITLSAEWTINDVSEYKKGLNSAIKNGAREHHLLSNGSVMPGAILVDPKNKQTTFFRLNPNDKKYKALS